MLILYSTAILCVFVRIQTSVSTDGHKFSHLPLERLTSLSQQKKDSGGDSQSRSHSPRPLASASVVRGGSVSQPVTHGIGNPRFSFADDVVHSQSATKSSSLLSTASRQPPTTFPGDRVTSISSVHRQQQQQQATGGKPSSRGPVSPRTPIWNIAGGRPQQDFVTSSTSAHNSPRASSKHPSPRASSKHSSRCASSAMRSVLRDIFNTPDDDKSNPMTGVDSDSAKTGESDPSPRHAPVLSPSKDIWNIGPSSSVTAVAVVDRALSTQAIVTSPVSSPAEPGGSAPATPVSSPQVVTETPVSTPRVTESVSTAHRVATPLSTPRRSLSSHATTQSSVDTPRMASILSEFRKSRSLATSTPKRNCLENRSRLFKTEFPSELNHATAREDVRSHGTGGAVKPQTGSPLPSMSSPKSNGGGDTEMASINSKANDNHMRISIGSGQEPSINVDSLPQWACYIQSDDRMLDSVYKLPSTVGVGTFLSN